MIIVAPRETVAYMTKIHFLCDCMGEVQWKSVECMKKVVEQGVLERYLSSI